ncbi:FAD-dependent oxidoreductase [Halomonas sp. NCCP-2165]|nr:FAD-dependent oxidoreductase [Halomonas sp. NCCP-2165]GKW50181.1 NADP oxidoreductase [Halomonas sp. NCCP-2165]
MTAPSIAIVGAGPSGCYLAQALRKQWAEARIDIFDRLPVPFGLVRYGVAPDHPGTKAVTRQFERLFERDGIGFHGNLALGRDLALDELREAYDVVALATGLAADRRLGIPGDDLPGVYGAGVLTRRLNDHPDEQGLRPDLGRRAVIIGQGNVGIDVLRLLSKPEAAFEGSELSPEALAACRTKPLARLDIVGRSSAAEAKCDAAMLRELGRLAGLSFHFAAPLPAPESVEDKAAGQRLAAFHELAECGADGEGCQIHFHFGWTPEAVLGEARVGGVRFYGGESGEENLELAADSLITAIGFTQHDPSLPGAPEAPRPDDQGRLAAGLYCTGWLRRGPRGTIPENRQDARAVAAIIAADLVADRAERPLGRPGFAALPAAVIARATDFSGWKRIQAVEAAEAPAGRLCRRIPDLARLLEIAQATPVGGP